jgi:nucleoside-diphosphate-sugar epimerase
VYCVAARVVPKHASQCRCSQADTASSEEDPLPTAAITGASGFIGKHVLAQLLVEGWSVRALTRKESNEPNGLVRYVRGDLTTASVADLEPFVSGCDVVIHCAGELHDPERMTALHVTGTSRLAEAAKGRIGRWVQLSSTGVYGPRTSGLITEDTPTAPVGAYEVTKWQSEEIVRETAGRGGFELSVLRPSIVFGEDMPNQSLRQMLNAIRAGYFAYIGAPGASANYVHVTDVARGLIACASHTRATGRAWNISGWATLETFIGAMAGGAHLKEPELRLPKAPLLFAATLLGSVPWFPLTPARVAALTSRARYDMDAMSDVMSFGLSQSLAESARQVGQAWSR